MGNTYKGSIRDGVKYLTCNGKLLDTYLEAGWGWYGLRTQYTAAKILQNEYGPKVSNNYFCEFARQWLATCPEEGFTIGSEYLAYVVKEIELDNYLMSNDVSGGI